jgi:hypothetical protein
LILQELLLFVNRGTSRASYIYREREMCVCGISVCVCSVYVCARAVYEVCE